MRRTGRAPLLRLSVVGLAALALAAPASATAAAHTARGTTSTTSPALTAPAKPDGSGRAVARSDVRSTGPDYNGGKALPLDKASLARFKKQVAARQAQVKRSMQAKDHAVGESLTWPALDDLNGPYLKQFTLRGIGDHIQVWVADDTSFPADDCRNALGLTDITDAQVNSFVDEFDTNIYPKESESFSVPPSQDGADAPLAPESDPDYYKVGSDQADDITVLVDNVRDQNYYDPTDADGKTYIAGFFYSYFNALTNRNLMTIDAFDWLHRTGANPPDDSADPDYQACASAQGQPAGRAYGAPKPRLYEGTFAHEYQHLLESYEDPDEVSWVNEGLSDYAQSLVGYVDTSVPPDQPAADSHLAAFAGFLDPSFGGPENSLTRWQDQGPPEILADYGAVYSFMTYLFDHYGEKFMSALHREDAGGLAGLDKVLDAFKSKKSAMDTVHDWALTVAVDQAADVKGGFLLGGRKADLTSKSLSSLVSWSNPQAYDADGAPANGSDYVRLRDADGNYLSAGDLKKLTFSGTKTFEPDPVEWTVDQTPPDTIAADQTCGSGVTPGTGGPALYSGCGPNLDRSIVREVTVPSSGDATLSFSTLYDTEIGYDFGFVQISTDGGKTYKSLATEDTTDEADPSVDPKIAAQLPGFNDQSDGWKTETADLSAYAGKSVVIAFRYITDSGTDEAGFWVKDVKLGSETFPNSLEGWESMTQVAPVSVAGYTVQLIAYDDRGHVIVTKLKIDKNFSGALPASAAKALSAAGRRSGGKAYPTVVAALVMQDDPKESATKQANYRLVANGVLQPGGGSD